MMYLKISKSILLFVTILSTFSSCAQPQQFSQEALQEKLTSINEEVVDFQDVLDKHKGKKIFIDVWASWCKDCLESIPKIKALQEQNPQVVFVFLSVDKKQTHWKSAINRLSLSGDHYFINKGFDGELSDFLNLNWIPRYLIIDESGTIEVFKATKTKDKQLKRSLK